MEQDNEADVQKEEDDTQEDEMSEEKEESDLDDIDEDSEQHRSSVSEAGSVRKSINEDQPAGGLSQAVRSLSKGQAITHFQLVHLLRKIMIATTKKTDNLTAVETEPQNEEVNNDDQSDSESDEGETNEEENFEPPSPRLEETSEVDNEA